MVSTPSKTNDAVMQSPVSHSNWLHTLVREQSERKHSHKYPKTSQVLYRLVQTLCVKMFSLRRAQVSVYREVPAITFFQKTDTCFCVRFYFVPNFVAIFAVFAVIHKNEPFFSSEVQLSVYRVLCHVTTEKRSCFLRLRRKLSILKYFHWTSQQ